MARVTAQVKDIHRGRLLEAAAAEFARHGRAAANINRISLTAGLAKGTVYNYFPSKDELFLAVVREACERVASRADRILPSSASTRSRLLAAVTSDLEWALGNEAFARVLVRESLAGDAQFLPQIEGAAAPYISHVARILQDGVERGEIRSDVPADELALLFVGLGELALVHLWGTRGRWPLPEQIPGLVVRQFLEGAAVQREKGDQNVPA